ncbi:hypothetical protein N431DRAFT_355272, partial [Stipitochalara longipes BDJ]
RSLTGCWTCRLRRKKCDERRPSCAKCEQLGIRCLEYGEKPDRMDGGFREKKMVEGIKNAIKVTRIRKRLFHHTNTGNTVQYMVYNTPLQEVSLQADNITEQSPVENIALECMDSWGSEFSFNSDFENAILLVHYIDHVLYIQFPFYYEALSHERRSWLLSLITTVKPIYYATMALSSYFKDAPELHDEDKRRSERYSENYNRALIELRNYIDNNRGDMEYTLKVSFCILQLIFCEVFEGGNDWQMHLLAASSLITSLTKPNHDLSLDQLASSSKGIESLKDTILGEKRNTATQTTMDMVIGTFVALDILSSASTRSPLQLQASHQHQHQNPPNDKIIKTKHLIGCDESVMCLISRVSILEEWKKGCEAKGALSIMELSKRASCIETELEDFASRNALDMQMAIQAWKMRGPCSTAIPSPPTSHQTSRIISSIFALSAITYLHVVVSGAFPDLAEIQQSVSKTLLAMKSLPNPQLLRRIVWPFCVTGCLSPKDAECDLRELALSAGASESDPGSLWQALRIMEYCWGRRDKNEPHDWTAAMSQLGTRVLLL